MNYLSYAQLIAQKAAAFNLDRVLDVLVYENDPCQLRRELQSIYFKVVNVLAQEGETGFVDELLSLQSIIEAIDEMTENVESATMTVTPKRN